MTFFLLNCLLDKYDRLCKITTGYRLFCGNERQVMRILTGIGELINPTNLAYTR